MRRNTYGLAVSGHDKINLTLKQILYNGKTCVEGGRGTNMHNPLAITNYFIELGKEKLTLMQLLKLSYIAHGFSLAISDKELSKELVQAWKFGPVFPSVYHEFKYQGSGPIKEYAEKLGPDKKTLVPIQGEFSDTENRTMQLVYDVYGNLNGWQLSALTHKEGTPWYQVWHNEEGSKYDGVPIKNQLIKDHFYKIISKYVEK